MWSAIIGGGLALAGGLSGARGAKKAAREQAAMTREALAEERRQFDVNRADLAPYREAGAASLGRIRDLLGIGESGMSTEEFMQLDPGYQFRLSEGEKAIERAARARGMYKSPATIKELLRYGQDYASGEFGNIFNRFAGTAGTGQTGALAGAQLGSASTGRIGELLTGLGNARGASAIARSNAWGDAFSTIGNWWNQRNMMNTLRGGNTGSQNPSWMSGYRNPFATVTN